MAEFMRKLNKTLLLELAEEFNTNVTQANTVRDIRQAILDASDYDVEAAKDYVARILVEAEQEKMEKKAKQERLDKLAEQERDERERVRAFELEKIKLLNSVETNSVASTVSAVDQLREKRANLKDLVPRFDPKEIDILLFFMLFEKQARKEKIDENNWVSQLISLVPNDIAQLIVKEPADKADDYQHVKKLLMQRFKLSSLALKTKFEEHNRKNEMLWVDLVYELRVYLDDWLDSVEVQDFESLKELMLTEQLKRRVPLEIREHYLDNWEEFKTASILAEKCDKYEALRRDTGRLEKKMGAKKLVEKSKDRDVDSNSRDTQKNRNHQNVKPDGIKKEESFKKESSQEANFDRQRKIRCYQCGENGHIRPNCPALEKNRANFVNNLGTENLGKCFEPYLKTALINGKESSSKGYGFVHFETEEAENNAIMKVNGRKVFFDKFIPRKEHEKLLGEKARRFMNVYLKNFGDDLDDEKLSDLFEKYGKITSAKVMTDKMGKSKGFGFVDFEEPESAEKAVEDLNGKEYNGKILYVGRAQKKSERAAELKRRFELMKMERMSRYQGVNLYVKNLDDAIDDERLRKEFAPFGTIISAKVMTDGNGRSRGFGFVCFSSPEEAAKAVTEMNGRIVVSKSLYVALAQRKEDRKAYLASQYMQRMAGMRMRMS